jgi:hypothetical protein
VRKQVLRYEKAKKAGTLKKTDRVATRLFWWTNQALL